MCRSIVICLSIATGIFTLASSAQAQRLSVPEDSLRKFKAQVPDSVAAVIGEYLTASDSAALSVLNKLRSQRGAVPFLVRVLATDPAPAVRASVARMLSGDFDDPAIASALRDRIEHDSSFAVIRQASQSLESIGQRQRRLSLIPAERIAAARAANDTALLRFAMDQEDDAMHERIVAPKFVRTPPPVFRVAPANASVRFVAFGDYGVAHLTGSRSTHQVTIAKAIAEFHAKTPLTFGITTGDNFYGTSFPTPDDPNWQISWVDQYERLNIPFYISIGNHDWGEPAGPMSEIIYSRTSKSWRFPAFYYTYTAGDAQFFVVNTNALSEKQLSWLRDELRKSTAKWKIVYGHYPTYEQSDYSVTSQRKLLEPIFKELGVDLYLCGHHHSMQHWNVGGIDYLVTGAGGAGSYPVSDTASAGRLFGKSAPGFVVVDVEKDGLTFRFIGDKGQTWYTYRRTK